MKVTWFVGRLNAIWDWMEYGIVRDRGLDAIWEIQCNMGLFERNHVIKVINLRAPRRSNLWIFKSRDMLGRRACSR